ncbi:MAG TPA: acyltransferase [Methylomirabilota bacterium]|jgi:peptidoglycan/LPS O-acetylase OafA/YrhL
MAVDTRTVAARGRWERVDQLRGLAALAVVVCHLAVSADREAPNLDGGLWSWLALVLGFGYLGVPLFFVISGFCIHLPQARALARADPVAAAPEWPRFFARRFWRLYPPYLASLVVALALWWLAGSPIPWLAVTTQALLVHAFHTATFDGVNPPAWTLAVEAQLYLAYPVVFWFVARLGALRALAAVLGVTMAYRMVLGLAQPLPAELGGPAWELFLARWFEWVLGAVVAEWAAGRLALPRVLSTRWPGAVTLAAGVLIEWHAGYYGLYIVKEPFYGVAFALILCAALAHERPGLGSAPGRYLARVGVYSYSLYLLHRPIQLAFEPLAREVATWPGVVAHGVPSSLLVMAATTPLVLWASRIFYRFCERPSIRRSQAL